MTLLKAPFPYFGGKSRIAAEVWSRFGTVKNYVEPFFGSGAVLLARPGHDFGIETVNDKDGLVANFWRAVTADPDAVAHHADWPAIENDLHARHAWLVGQKDSLQERLEGDPDYFDAKIAGWWVWGMACWIGGEFCSGKGPWQVVEAEDGTRRLLRLESKGQGVYRKRLHLGGDGQGVQKQSMANGLTDWMRSLAKRLQRVRVCCGDWLRVCGPTVTTKQGLTGVFLDPPYHHAGRDKGLYRQEMSCADAVRDWAISQGNNRLFRIALCGYEGEHALPKGWKVFAWKTQGGMSNQSKRKEARGKANRDQERIWFSPHCLEMPPMLFDFEDVTGDSSWVS